MSQNPSTCPQCGAVSSDPEFCDVCGADLSVSDWYLENDTFAVLLNQPAARDRSGHAQSASLEDTLPPVPMWSQRPVQDTDPLGKRRVHATTGARFVLDIDEHDHTLPGVLIEPRSDIGTELVTLKLVEAVYSSDFKRTWVAESEDGRKFRVEERRTPNREAIPAAISQLHWLIDIPLGAVGHGAHEVKVYRHIPGELLSDRLQKLPGLLSPSDIVDWVRPVVKALDAIHEAGFVCLRICPHTVKYAADGTLFLQNVETLYARDSALAMVPAIGGYSAPEVYAASLAEPPGVAADFYMLGMLVYYLITKRDPPATIYSGHAPIVSARDMQPEFPLGFAPVIELLSARVPANRPRNATEVLDRLYQARDRAVRLPGAELLKIGVAADTHVGIIKRLHNPVNQDAVFAGAEETGVVSLFLVADGVSTASYGSGDLASGIAKARVERAWAEYLHHPDRIHRQGIREWLVELMRNINSDVISYVNSQFAPFRGEPSEVMGSTCILGFVRNGMVTLLSLGDSRAYCIRDGQIEQITRDHNLITLGVAEGVPADVAVTFAQGEALARCLGTFDVDDSGNLVDAELEPDIYVFSLMPGDRIVVCTDGFTDYAGTNARTAEQIMLDIVTAERVPELACLDLIKAANGGGGGDNIGVALIYADPFYPSLYDWFHARRGGLDEG